MYLIRRGSAIRQGSHHQGLTSAHIPGGKELSIQMMGAIPGHQPPPGIGLQEKGGEGAVLAADEPGGNEQQIAGKGPL